MVGMFTPVFVFAVLALGVGVHRFWNDASAPPIARAALAQATSDALRLKYLDGGHGDGCNEVDDAFTLARRRWHHFTFYGFLLCFAATCAGTLYHYAFGWRAPYEIFSLPKLLGLGGGISLTIGSVGLLWLNLRRHPLHADAAQKPMDRGFIALLLLAALTGLALMLGRNSNALALLLALHLGVVMALFLTLPYGKFAHGVYRCAALLKWAIERRQPNTLGLSDD
jgi:citrate/tricarballylate utilization protein